MLSIILVWIVSIACGCLADDCSDTSTTGRTFVFGATHGRDKYDDQETDSLHISSQTSGHVTIQTNNTSMTYNISEGLTTLDIPKYLRHQKEGKHQKGIVITADTDIVAYVFQNYPLYDSSGITLLPIEALSNSYIVTSYAPFSIYYRTYIVVVSFMDATSIEVTLRTENSSRITLSHPTLNKFETFFISRDHDLSGTLVTSNNPVGVFTGTDCIEIPYGIDYGNCDRIDSQIVPSIYLGTDYIVPSMHPRLAYMVRIVNTLGGTNVVLTNKTDSWTLSLNKSGEFQDIFLGTDPLVIQSNHKVAVYQYAVSHAYDETAGSEYMAALPPVNQYLTNYLFPTQLKPNYYSWTYRNYASVIIETGKWAGMLVNDTTPVPVQNHSLQAPYSKYSVFTIELSGTSQNISHEGGSAVKFGLIAYGQNLASGYGFTGGRHFKTSEPINVALGKPASQSSLLNGFGKAFHAVDGNRNQTQGAGSCTHTKRTSSSSWWTVDLLAVYNISSMTIFNRMDCCYHRLDNSRIDFAVEAGKFTHTITVHGSFGFQRTWNLTNIQARYVKVSTPAHQFLTLCEVEIYGVLSSRGKRRLKNSEDPEEILHKRHFIRIDTVFYDKLDLQNCPVWNVKPTQGSLITPTPSPATARTLPTKADTKAPGTSTASTTATKPSVANFTGDPSIIGTTGRTFVFGATHGRDNYYDQETDSLHISSQTSGHVTIQTNNTSMTYNISEGLTTLDIPKYLRHENEGKHQKGIVITADTDIVAYVFQNYPLYDSSGITLLPIEALSNSYILTSYAPSNTYYRTYFVVVSFMDATNIEVTLRTENSSRIFLLKQTLNKFETYFIKRDHDLSGTSVTSNNPVGVFTGTDCLDVPHGIDYGNCDRIDTQIIPSIYLGTDYIVPSMHPRLAYMVRIVNIIGGTNVVLTNKTDSWTLSLNKSGEFQDIFLGTDPLVIQSNHKVAVYQYAVSHAYDKTAGSEYMAAVPPVNQFSTNYLFPTQLKPNYYSWTYRNFASVIIETGKWAGMLVNGTAPVPVQNHSLPAPFSKYSVFTLELSGTSQNISHEGGSAVKFGLIAYGQNLASGYGFTGGRHFKTSEPINVAMGKPTSQSSLLSIGKASHAVDGNRNQTLGAGSCTHTKRMSSSSWWTVDLLAVYNISSMTIFNRMDCCYDRLDNSRIDVAVEAGKFTHAITVHGSFGFQRTWNLTNIQARYVKVSTHAHQYLTLCEVEIYGVLSYRECPVVTMSPATGTLTTPTSSPSTTGTLPTKADTKAPSTPTASTAVTKPQVTNFTGDPGIIG